MSGQGKKLIKMIPRITIASRALRTITEETNRFPSVETGGILIGKKLTFSADEPVIVIMAATGPGPGADHGYATFAPNINYQQEILDFYARNFGTTYLGSWHKHPVSHRNPSTGDLFQARSILNDPDYSADELIIPIVTKGAEAIVRPFYISRQTLSFVSVDWEVFDADTYTSIWGPAWFHLKFGRERYIADKRSLLETGAREVRAIPMENRFAYYLKTAAPLVADGKETDELVFLCNLDYPGTPPETYLIVEEQEHAVKLQGLRRWRPSTLLGDLLAELLPEVSLKLAVNETE